MRRVMIAALAIAAAASPLHAAPARATLLSGAQVRPKRIVSLNLCADQLILTLADRSQIAGLTRNAAKTNMSAEAARTKGLRILGTSAEEILEIDPDLVVGIPARRNAILRALKMRHYPAVDLKSADTLEDIYASIRAVSEAVGHPDRGEAMIAGMEAELARTPKLGRGRVAVYYQRRGYVTGTGTLVDDLMHRVGLVNLATKLGKSTLSQMSLEEMVAARPDFLIVESATDKVTDQGTEMLHHPALDSIPRLHIPEAWTVCGGPAYTKAVRTLTEQLRRYR